MYLYMFDIYKNNSLCQEDDRNFLKHFKEYGDEEKENSCIFTYQHQNSPELIQLREKYKLDEIAEQGTDIEKQDRLAKWLTSQLHYGKKSDFPMPFNSDFILENSRKKNFLANCWSTAVVLNEIFLAFGFPSRAIRCMPMDLRYSECHCVTITYSKEYQKWIIWDASMNVRYLNENGIPLSIEELRHFIMEGKRVVIPRCPRIRAKRILNYWCKNLIRFECFRHSAFNMESMEQDAEMIALNPKEFQLKDSVMTRGNHQLFYHYLYSPQIFWQKPQVEEE